LQAWYRNYSKNFRDALAHRIPIYVPPSVLSEKEAKRLDHLQAQIAKLDFNNLGDIEMGEGLLDQQAQLGRASPTFGHLPSEEGKSVYLHAQVIVDYLTIEEIVFAFCKIFNTKTL